MRKANYYHPVKESEILTYICCADIILILQFFRLKFYKMMTLPIFYMIFFLKIFEAQFVYVVSLKGLT